MRFFLILLISLLSVAEWVYGDFVKVRNGIVNGTTMVAANGKLFNAFFGIPYAIPPIGELRFKAPIEAPPLSGIFNATKKPNICVQLPEGDVTTSGNEDCLTLNVYSPRHARAGDNIPVIFYIFGGVFKYGSNLIWGPQNFMTRDVIMAMPNFRVGVFGFLSTGDTVISGNMGLKDQSLALKWVKNYIHAFGGDPNRITIHGHSSGATSAHLHTLSPMSKGLFNRAIFQSGTGFCPGSFFDKDVARSIAKELALRVGCNITTTHDMYSCFMNLRPEIFPLAQEDMYLWRSSPDAIFRPTIEDESAESPFLTTPPVRSAYQTTHQEWMIGITSGEGSSYAGSYLSNDGELAKELNDHYRILLPLTLQYLWHSKWKNLDFTSNLLRKHYFDNQEIGVNTSSALFELYSQGMFGSGTNDAFRRYPGKKYVYLFDYLSAFSIHTSLTNYGKIYGIGHAEELPLLFYHNERSKYLNCKDRIFGDEMVKRWTNFAYSGNPNEPFPINETIFGLWSPSLSPKVDYLRLKSNGSMETDFFTDEYHFWKHLPIFSKYY